MSEFREFAEAIRADLFGSPEAATKQAERQADLVSRAEMASRANARAGASTRIVDAGIPARVMAVVRACQEKCAEDFGYVLPDPIPQATRATESGPTVLVVLQGPPGEGKSVAAAYALSHAIELGRQGLWLTGVQIARILGSFDRNDAAKRQRAETTDVLVVDDLGMESARDTRAAPLIAGLLLLRYEAKRPTIVTTNLVRPEDLRARYGAQVYDRLRTRGGLLYRCNGRDYRST